MEQHQTASDVFFKVFDGLPSYKNLKSKMEVLQRDISQPNTTIDKAARRSYKKKQNKLVLKLNCESPEPSGFEVPLSSEVDQKGGVGKRKFPVAKSVTTKKKSKHKIKELGSTKGLSLEETEALHKKRLKELESEMKHLAPKPLRTPKAQLKKSTTSKKKKSDPENGVNPASLQGVGCWTCRIRHKSCPQDAERCSTCVRLGLFCDRSPTRPKYMVNKESCRKIKRDIKEITDSSRGRLGKRKKVPGGDLESPGIKPEPSNGSSSEVMPHTEALAPE